MSHAPHEPSLPGFAPPDFKVLGDVERFLASQGLSFVAGIDEAGRGPLAGPVTAACVLWPIEARLPGLDDSKALSEAKRRALVPQIKALALGYGVAFVSAARIDAVNILNASKEAWQKALDLAEKRAKKLAPCVVIDGNQALPGARRQLVVVKGDALSSAVAAASILAKEARDSHLRALDKRYPGYDLAKHKGYPTAAHLQALASLGPSPIHRRSFRGVVGETAEESS